MLEIIRGNFIQIQNKHGSFYAFIANVVAAAVGGDVYTMGDFRIKLGWHIKGCFVMVARLPSS